MAGRPEVKLYKSNSKRSSNSYVHETSSKHKRKPSADCDDDRIVYNHPKLRKNQSMNEIAVEVTPNPSPIQSQTFKYSSLHHPKHKRINLSSSSIQKPTQNKSSKSHSFDFDKHK